MKEKTQGAADDITGSGSRICYPTPHDLPEALEYLAECKHWTIKTLNSRGNRRGYECTIWSNGRRVSASSVESPFMAVRAAFAKLNEFKLKIVG